MWTVSLQVCFLDVQVLYGSEFPMLALFMTKLSNYTFKED